MNCSRRELGMVLPMLAAMTAEGQNGGGGVLPSKCYQYDELPVKVNAEAHSESRQVFRGETHEGFAIACHMTKLAQGHSPHAPHQHVNEEMLFVREGKLEMTVNGKSCVIGPGSMIYIASNEMHGSKSVGDVAAEYFVLELDGMKGG